MTTLNTIIEEEKVRFGNLYVEVEEVMERSVLDKYERFLTTAMQRAYEAGREADPLKGERRRIIEQICQEERAKWLRSEIEKLEGEKKNYPMIDEPEWRRGYTEALEDQITRYKEELLELEKGV